VYDVIPVPVVCVPVVPVPVVPILSDSGNNWGWFYCHWFRWPVHLDLQLVKYVTCVAYLDDWNVRNNFQCYFLCQYVASVNHQV
jgi:hypothetical protein